MVHFIEFMVSKTKNVRNFNFFKKDEKYVSPIDMLSSYSSLSGS